MSFSEDEEGIKRKGKSNPFDWDEDEADTLIKLGTADETMLGVSPRDFDSKLMRDFLKQSRTTEPVEKQPDPSMLEIRPNAMSDSRLSTINSPKSQSLSAGSVYYNPKQRQREPDQPSTFKASAIRDATEQDNSSISEVIKNKPQASVKDYNTLQAELIKCKQTVEILKHQKWRSIPPQETIKRIMLGKPYSLEGYKSLGNKQDLLDFALKWHDGNAILAVILFLKRTLKGSIFLEEINRRPAALSHYVDFLRENKEFDTLITLYGDIRKMSDAASLQYQQAMQAKDMKDQLSELRILSRDISNRNTTIDLAMVVQEHANLLEKQIRMETEDLELESNGRHSILRSLPRKTSVPGKSLLTTVYYASLYHYDDKEVHICHPSNMRQTFKLTAKQYEWSVIPARAKLQRWTDIADILLTKKWLKSVERSAIGFEELTSILQRFGAPVVIISKYLMLIENVDTRLKLAFRYKCHDAAIDTLVTIRNRKQLEDYRMQVLDDPRSRQKINDLLNNSDGNENRNDHAGHVFLLMGKKYRISRSIRGQWFFQHIKSLVCAPSNENIIPSQEELEIISVIPENAYLQDQNHSSKWCIVPSTNITFIGREYRFVFCFDFSPSVATVDVESGLVLLEEMFENFKNCVTGLIQPFCVPGSNLRLMPDLRVTVLAHIPVATSTCQILIQGYHLTLDSLTEFIVTVQSKLIDAEDYLADFISEYNRTNEASASTERRKPETLLPPEASLFMMFRDCLLALQLLPDNASAGLVIITDGAFGLIDANAVDAVLAQMRASTVVCSFLAAGKSSPCFTMRYGYVAQFALMQFIATATSGAYIGNCPEIQPDDGSAFLLGIKGKPEMNVYHRSLYCWSFQQDVDQDKILTNESKAGGTLANCHPSLITTSISPGSSLLSPHVIHTIKIFETKLNTRIASVLSVRLREGYAIDRVTLSKDGTHLDVKLLLPWKEHVFVEYYAKAAWPLDLTRKQTNVEMHVGGLYEFLHDLRSKSKNFAYYRKTVIKKFELFVKSLQSTDELLVRLQSFSSNALYYKIPESAKSAVPLFYLPPNSATPVLSHQHGHGRSSHTHRRNTHKSDESLFAAFWKPVLSLDPKTWQRWFHSHRVSLVLENDRPIPSSLFLMSANGRYSSVHCRVAMSSLNVLLKEWSSFVLLENHSYVRFLSKSNEERPYSFCILRLQFKGLSIVIRAAFLGGTAGSERHKVVSDLKGKLAALIIPNNKPLFAIDVSPPDSPVKILQDRKEQLKCVLFMGKPLERILIKYDAIPEDLINDDNSDGSSSQYPASVNGSPDKGPELMPTPQTNSYVSNARLTTLSLSLYSQRWIWKMSYGGSNSLSKVAVARMLLALTKTRLQEGFHFGSSSGGIVTLVKELQMKSRKFEPYELAPCVLQFVLFPPHHASSGSRTGLIEDLAEVDYYIDTGNELQMVTEVWIEPQFGHVVPNDEAAVCFKDLTYNDLAKTIFNIDKNLIEELTTYACLESLCCQRLLSPSISPLSYDSGDLYSKGNVIKIPFLYDLMSLLKQSNLVLMCYPLLRKAKELVEDAESTNKFQNSILIDLISKNLHQIHNVSLSSAEVTNDVNNLLSSCCLSQMIEYGMLPTASGGTTTSNVNWTGFAREASSRLLLTFMPSSIDDVEEISKPRNESDHMSDKPSMKNTNADHAHCPLQIFPIIVFECCYSNLGAVAKPECDKIFQDYTTAFLDVDVDISQTDNKTSKLHDAFKDGELLREHCHSIYERYFRSFVCGVFENLQQGQVLDERDIDSSVEMICEESCIQIDITKFVQILCSHFQQLSNINHDDDVFVASKSVDNSIDVTSPRRKRSISSSSQKQAKSKCDREEIHNIVQERFRHIMERYFHAISNHKHVFFFVKPSSHVEFESLSMLSDDINDINDFFDVDMNHTRVRTKDIDEDPQTNLSQCSGRSLKGSTVCDVHDASSESVEMLSTVDMFSVNSENVDDKLIEQDDVPLFIHLTSTVKFHTEDGTSIRTCSVESLPSCLADLVAKVSNNDQDQPMPDTFANIQSITLDLNCLTLPHETDSDNITTSKSQLTSDFDDTVIPSQGVDDISSAEGATKQRTYTEQESLIDDRPQSAISLLPKLQQNALHDTGDAIDWLLKDEIASSLRSVQPVNVDVLSLVEEHINMAVTRSSASNLKKTKLPLKFVFGFEKSIDYFVDRLEQTNMNGYALLRCDNYYYVAKSVDELQQENSFGIDKNADEAMTSSEKDLSKIETKHLTWDEQLLNRSTPQIEVTSDCKEETQQSSTSQEQMGNEATHSSEVLLNNKELDLLGPPRPRSNTFPRLPKEIKDPSEAPPMYPRKRSSSVTEESFLKHRSLTYPLGNADSINLRKIAAQHNLLASRKDQVHDTHDDVTISYKTEIIDKFGNSFSNDLGDDFWIFLKIEKGGFGPVYFHERKLLVSGSQHDQLYESLLYCMEEICMLVNQKMLLDDLHEKDMCRDILIAPDDEDWSSDNVRADSPDPLYLNTPGSQLAHVSRTEVEFEPGHFECRRVWQTYIPIHYRLKPPISQGAKAVSRGFMAAKSILDSFTVSNRSNVFVFKEDSGNVFYFRICEVTLNADKISLRKIEEDATREEAFSILSRTSSLMSLQSTAYQTSVTSGRVQAYDSPQDYVPKRSGSIASGDGHSTNELSAWGTYTGIEYYIHFTVYGICQPGNAIKVDLIQSLKKRIDEVTINRLNLLLTRNPKSKLALPDVQFIQPPCRPPVCCLRFGLPPIMHPYTHSFMYYLRQLLLVEFNTPRFADSHRDQFRNYTQYDTQSHVLDYPVIPINDQYLYVERGKEGVYVGCFYLSLVNRSGDLVKAHPVTPTPAYTNKSPDYYRKWLDTLMSCLDEQTCEEGESWQAQECDAYVQFSIWGRGEIPLTSLLSCLRANVKAAISDVFLEYILLANAISSFPPSLMRASFRSHSSSSKSDTPTSPYFKTISAHSIASQDSIGRGTKSSTGTPTSPISQLPLLDTVRQIPFGDSASPTDTKQRISKKLSLPSVMRPRTAPSHSMESPGIDSLHLSESSTTAQSDCETSNRSTPKRRVSTADHRRHNSNPFPLPPELQSAKDASIKGRHGSTVESPETIISENAAETSRWQDIELRRRKEATLKLDRYSYEAGNKGALSSCYIEPIKDCFDCISKLSSPSVHTHSKRLSSDYSVSFVLRESVKILGDLFPEITPRIFTKIECASESDSVSFQEIPNDANRMPIKTKSKYVPYHLEREAIKVGGKEESSMDIRRLPSFIPRQSSNFVVIVRNVHQWRSCMGIHEDDLENAGSMSTEDQFSRQLFPPFEIATSSNPQDGRRSGASHCAPSSLRVAPIPRQKFFAMYFEGRQVSLYSYNLSKEMRTVIDNRLLRLYAWHQARDHLNSCIMMQKAGLFHHMAFESAGQNENDENLLTFCSTNNHGHLLMLMKDAAPPATDRMPLTDERTNKLASQLPLQLMYRDSSPHRILSRAPYRFVQDPVKRFGYQYQEVRSVKMNNVVQQAKISEVHEMWMRGEALAISEDRLHLLRHHSRIVHFGEVKVLFDFPTQRNADASNADSSIKDKVSNIPFLRADSRSSEEDKHRELSTMLLQEYSHSVEVLGFSTIQIGQSSRRNVKSQSPRGSSVALETNPSDPSKKVKYLQKTRPGGIALFELSIQGGYFSLVIYALETSKIKSIARSVRNEEAKSFLEDCSKLRDLTFMKSFYYDFHLRHIYQFISGKQPAFEQGYSVQMLLRKMLHEYPSPPIQSWSTLKEGTVKLPCAQKLNNNLIYNYMVANCQSYGLSMLTVNEPLTCGPWQTNQLLTVSLVTTKNSSTFTTETKRIDKQLVITPYNVNEDDVFALHFYMLLVNRKDVYLRPSFASKQSRLKIARQRAISGSDGGSLTSVGDHQAAIAVKHRVRFNSSTKVGSGEYMDLDASYNTESLTTKVASLPGSFQADVSYGFQSHGLTGTNTNSGSDTILVLTNTSPADHRKLSTQSLTPDLKPSDSSDSDSSSWIFSNRTDRASSFGQIQEATSISDTRFIAEETTYANKLVQKACVRAMTDCWRDAIWYGILLSIQKESDTIRKKKKDKDVCVGIDLTHWRVDSLLFQQHNTSDQVSHDLIQRLLHDVTSIPLSKIDKDLQCSLSLCTTAQQTATMRHLSSKFECLCRSFTSSNNGNAQCSFVVVNPNNYDMMIYIMCEDAGQMDVSVLFRKAPTFDLTEQRHRANWTGQEIACLQHLENVLSCLCFSLWTRLIPL